MLDMLTQNQEENYERVVERLSNLIQTYCNGKG
jgi:hypothetical protein